MFVNGPYQKVKLLKSRVAEETCEPTMTNTVNILKQFCVYCRGQTQNKSFHESCLIPIMELNIKELFKNNFKRSFPAQRESFENSLYADIFELDKRYIYCDYCGKRRTHKGIISYKCSHNYCKMKIKQSCRVIALFFEDKCIFCNKNNQLQEKNLNKYDPLK